jgi:curved DNA-binding protein CbpA
MTMVDTASVDYYAIVGVRPDAAPEAIRAAYRELARRYHPDTTTLPKSEAANRFIELQEAFDVLSDPERRSRYDDERAPAPEPKPEPEVQRRPRTKPPRAPQRDVLRAAGGSQVGGGFALVGIFCSALVLALVMLIAFAR